MVAYTRLNLLATMATPCVRKRLRHFLWRGIGGVCYSMHSSLIPQFQNSALRPSSYCL
ncbi:hypothetical protein F751_1883 [Auxenochlorella protothecoides]|uniref:Uncharacterized protein n=1 Tax=Auxenochlorella protothecoides TaxID=3075 RepID=A0A087SH00_AUXPR|nr:hypothetical protein F751_1883 [Auxenochlorella protothecoides]KFM25004.1 hypothetical protein F751_1883 [Auxenochlorella protothecoides]